MTLEELKSKVPEQLAPWVEKYGAIFLQMSADELMAWIEMIIKGDQGPAMQIVFEKMNDDELINAWTNVNASWQAANVKNAEKLEMTKAAAMAVAKICLILALGAVGL